MPVTNNQLTLFLAFWMAHATALRILLWLLLLSPDLSLLSGTLPRCHHIVPGLSSREDLAQNNTAAAICLMPAQARQLGWINERNCSLLWPCAARLQLLLVNMLVGSGVVGFPAAFGEYAGRPRGVWLSRVSGSPSASGHSCASYVNACTAAAYVAPINHACHCASDVQNMLSHCRRWACTRGLLSHSCML